MKFSTDIYGPQNPTDSRDFTSTCSANCSQMVSHEIWCRHQHSDSFFSLSLSLSSTILVSASTTKSVSIQRRLRLKCVISVWISQLLLDVLSCIVVHILMLPRVLILIIGTGVTGLWANTCKTNDISISLSCAFLCCSSLRPYICMSTSPWPHVVLGNSIS